MGQTVSPRHVAVAAEAIAAAQFARYGFDVFVQYGANQPEYDLVVVRGEKRLKVSVKGSQDGSWGLTQSLLRRGRADYHAAAEQWRKRHKPGTVLCFVQFEGTGPDQMPRLYLATPREVESRLKAARKGLGGTILYKHKVWGPRAVAAGTIEKIPDSWRFTSARVEVLLREA